MAELKYILLAEDNPADVLMLTRCLDEALSIKHKIIVAKNGEEAIDSIKGQSLVDLIILDLNMPKVNGHQVLKDLKTEEKTKHIPIIILTSSDDSQDIQEAYTNHANCYIQKSKDLAGFKAICSRINEFWIETVQLPGSES